MIFRIEVSFMPNNYAKLEHGLSGPHPINAMVCSRSAKRNTTAIAERFLGDGDACHRARIVQHTCHGLLFVAHAQRSRPNAHKQNVCTLVALVRAHVPSRVR
jgi:hypothetical protein